MTEHTRPWYLQLAVVLLSITASMTLVVLVRKEFNSQWLSTLRLERQPGVGHAARQPDAPGNHHQIVFVFIATSNCAGIRVRGFKSALDSARSEVERRAKEQGAEFRTIGVSLDWSLTDGEKLLDRFGPFDEIVVGDNWMNIAAMHFIWRDLPGAPEVPQVIVMSRLVSFQPRTVIFGEEKVLARQIGADGLRKWAAAHATF